MRGDLVHPALAARQARDARAGVGDGDDVAAPPRVHGIAVGAAGHVIVDEQAVGAPFGTALNAALHDAVGISVARRVVHRQIVKPERAVPPFGSRVRGAVSLAAVGPGGQIARQHRLGLGVLVLFQPAHQGQRDLVRRVVAVAVVAVHPRLCDLHLRGAHAGVGDGEALGVVACHFRPVAVGLGDAVGFGGDAEVIRAVKGIGRLSHLHARLHDRIGVHLACVVVNIQVGIGESAGVFALVVPVPGRPGGRFHAIGPFHRFADAVLRRRRPMQLQRDLARIVGVLRLAVHPHLAAGHHAGGRAGVGEVGPDLAVRLGRRVRLHQAIADLLAVLVCIVVEGPVSPLLAVLVVAVAGEARLRDGVGVFIALVVVLGQVGIQVFAGLRAVAVRQPPRLQGRAVRAVDGLLRRVGLRARALQRQHDAGIIRMIRAGPGQPGLAARHLHKAHAGVCEDQAGIVRARLIAVVVALAAIGQPEEAVVVRGFAVLDALLPHGVGIQVTPRIVAIQPQEFVFPGLRAVVVQRPFRRHVLSVRIPDRGKRLRVAYTVEHQRDLIRVHVRLAAVVPFLAARHLRAALPGVGDDDGIVGGFFDIDLEEVVVVFLRGKQRKGLIRREAVDLRLHDGVGERLALRVVPRQSRIGVGKAAVRVLRRAGPVAGHALRLSNALLVIILGIAGPIQPQRDVARSMRLFAVDPHLRHGDRGGARAGVGDVDHVGARLRGDRHVEAVGAAFNVLSERGRVGGVVRLIAGYRRLHDGVFVLVAVPVEHRQVVEGIGVLLPAHVIIRRGAVPVQGLDRAPIPIRDPAPQHQRQLIPAVVPGGGGGIGPGLRAGHPGGAVAPVGKGVAVSGRQIAVRAVDHGFAVVVVFRPVHGQLFIALGIAGHAGLLDPVVVQYAVVVIAGQVREGEILAVVAGPGLIGGIRDLRPLGVILRGQLPIQRYRHLRAIVVLMVHAGIRPALAAGHRHLAIAGVREGIARPGHFIAVRAAGDIGQERAFILVPGIGRRTDLYPGLRHLIGIRIAARVVLVQIGEGIGADLFGVRGCFRAIGPRRRQQYAAVHDRRISRNGRVGAPALQSQLDLGRVQKVRGAPVHPRLGAADGGLAHAPVLKAVPAPRHQITVGLLVVQPDIPLIGLPRDRFHGAEGLRAVLDRRFLYRVGVEVAFLVIAIQIAEGILRVIPARGRGDRLRRRVLGAGAGQLKGDVRAGMRLAAVLPGLAAGHRGLARAGVGDGIARLGHREAVRAAGDIPQERLVRTVPRIRLGRAFTVGIVHPGLGHGVGVRVALRVVPVQIGEGVGARTIARAPRPVVMRRVKDLAECAIGRVVARARQRERDLSLVVPVRVRAGFGVRPRLRAGHPGDAVAPVGKGVAVSGYQIAVRAVGHGFAVVVVFLPVHGQLVGGPGIAGHAGLLDLVVVQHAAGIELLQVGKGEGRAVGPGPGLIGRIRKLRPFRFILCMQLPIQRHRHMRCVVACVIDAAVHPGLAAGHADDLAAGVGDVYGIRADLVARFRSRRRRAGVDCHVIAFALGVPLARLGMVFPVVSASLGIPGDGLLHDVGISAAQRVELRKAREGIDARIVARAPRSIIVILVKDHAECAVDRIGDLAPQRERDFIPVVIVRLPGIDPRLGAGHPHGAGQCVGEVVAGLRRLVALAVGGGGQFEEALIVL